MKEKMKRIIAGLLLAGLVVSGVPAAAVYAEEGSTEPPVQTQETDEAQNAEAEELAVNNIFNKEEADDETSAQEESVQEESAQEEAVQEEPAEDADREDVVQNESVQEKSEEEPVQEDAEQKDEVSAGTINFVYIEKPYLTTPDTQRIVVAFDEEISGADEIALTVEDESGSQTEWPLAKEKDGLYLFEKEFTGEAYTGTYQAVSLQLGDGDGAETVDLADMDIQAEFGVNEEYDGYDELQPMDEEAAAEDAVETSVVTIDENGVTEAQNDIADALNTAGIQTAGISTFSRAASRSVEPRTGNIVIALDPGHDSRSPGASANGLKEEVLTLKIAKYCKAELEKYDGVEIYMTRTDADCPFDMSGAGCIEKRVNAAADAGAQIYVSFHLNSSTSSTPKGAEVIIQNKNWRPEVAEESEALAEKIMDELVALGLSEREIYYRNSEAGEKYADGSSADYFSVHRNCKLRNIPGIIIEHAFLTNSSDVNSFLKTEAGLKKLGVADAKGIAKYLGLDQGQWKTDEDGKRYFYVKGQKVTGEKKIGNAWYYFDKSTGVMQTGFVDLGSKIVYYDKDGRMVLGKEQKIDGNWYYFDKSTGAMKTGFVHLGSRTVYYDKEGRMVLGKEQKVDGYWYYFDKSNGAMKTGFWDFGSKIVYYDKEGRMLLGKEQKIGGNWYYFDKSNGAMKTGFVNLGNKIVYYDEDGAMVRGEERKIDGYWYYFDSVTGAKKTGFVDLGTKTVYYDKDGHMLFGEQTINGKSYYFKSDGALVVDGFANRKYYGKDGILVPVSDYNLFFFDIDGESNATVDQMVRYFEKSGKSYPEEELKAGGAATIREFAQIVLDEAEMEDIKAEVIWAQIMHETGFLQFGGQVKIEQYNFAGLGATDDGAAGASFERVQMGVRAQVQHMKAYANAESLVNECVDPRFHLVNRNSAEYVEILGQQENPAGAGWATSINYGVYLRQGIDNILAL